MSRSSSPFFREYEQKSEISPLLAGDATRQTRFDGRIHGKQGSKVPKPSRLSMPLVYTDFRSPEVVRPNPIDTKGTGGRDTSNVDPSSSAQRTPRSSQTHPLKDAINRHSLVTNLESIGSKTVWMILLAPIILGVVAYYATVPWRYRSWTTDFTDDHVVSITSPRALHQAGFIRSFVSLPGYSCDTDQCSDEILNLQVHRVTRDSSDLRPVRLLHSHLNLTQYVADCYAPLHNNSVSTNKTILVPLPMLRLDRPVAALNPNSDKIHIQASLTATLPSGSTGSGTDSADNPDRTNGDGGRDTADSTGEATDFSTHNARSANAMHTTRALLDQTTPPTIEVITSTRTYTLCVAILQIFLSLFTFICLLRIVGHVYVNAGQLRDKFASVHRPTSPAHSAYGTMHSAYSMQNNYEEADEMLTLDSQRSESSIWHFILPEQYSAVSMLFFLWLWQGLLPAVCVVCYDIGLHVSEGLLFSAGVVASVAQYGLLFSLIVYIDGLKYHSNTPYKPRTRNTRTVTTNAYDPFDTTQSDNTNTTTYLDAHSTDYWRRSTARVCTFDNTTPLQREYKNAIALYITYHHPCSTDFVGFLYKKLIMLLLTWVLVVVYWLLYYPRIWHRGALTQVQYDDVSFRYDIVGYVLLAVSVLWGYWIVQVSVSTGVRLRRLKLNASRFRQVAYRTLLFQMQLGLLVLLGVSLYYSYTHSFFAHTSFRTTSSSLHYLYLWCGYYGLLHPTAVHTPPLAVHGIETLLFVSALVYSIAYCMQPPQEDPATSKFNVQAFVAMERSLPEYTHNTYTYHDTTTVNSSTNGYTLHTPTAKQSIQRTAKTLHTLKQHLVDEEYRKFMALYLKRVMEDRNHKRYFCIETALILLEISYQTYFSVDTLSEVQGVRGVGVGGGKSVTYSSTVDDNSATSNTNHPAAIKNNGSASASITINNINPHLHTIPSDHSLLSISNSSASGGYSTANSPVYSSNTTPRYNTTTTNTTSNSTTTYPYTANAAAMFGGSAKINISSGKVSGSNTSSHKSISSSAKSSSKNPFEEDKTGKDSNPFDFDDEDQDQVQDQDLDQGKQEEEEKRSDEGNQSERDHSNAVVEASKQRELRENGEEREELSPKNPFDEEEGEEGESQSVIGAAAATNDRNPFNTFEAGAAIDINPNNPFEEDYVDANSSAQLKSTSHKQKQTNVNSIPKPKPSIASSNGAALPTISNVPDIPETVVPSEIPVPENVNVPRYGPKLNLAGLGYTLRNTFSCEEYTTFGFLATECSGDGDSPAPTTATHHAPATANANNTSPIQCEYIHNKIVVSFRGSLLGNAVTNLKVAQTTLPSLKRPRAYFTKLIRQISSGEAYDSSHHAHAAHGAHKRSNTLTSEDCDLIRDADPTHYTPSSTAHHTRSYDAFDLNASYDNINSSLDHSASDIQEEYQTLLQRMESQENYENEDENENFVPPESSSAAAQLKNTQLAQNISNVGKTIPLLNQGFKRVHAGFWQSYSSIREEYMRAVVGAIYAHRTQILHALQTQSNVSPAHSMYVAHNSSSANTPISNRKTGTSNTNSAIKALFSSPLGVKNPFSPLFSPTHNNNNNYTNNSGAVPTPQPAASLPSSEINTSLEVVFCGHSLGAAIASLAAFELSENIKPILEALALEALFNVPKTQALQTLPLLHSLPAPVVSLYMYGAPRVGNSVFATTLNRKINNIYRIMVNGDVVTMLPKFIGFYRHAGVAVLLDDKERGNVIIQPSIIESSMLQYYTGSVLNHSLDKYRACLEACLEPAELSEYLTREFQNLHSTAVNTGVVYGDGYGAGTIGVGGGVRGSKRLSVSKSDVPEWLVSNSNNV